jgi:hypothetical protein
MKHRAGERVDYVVTYLEMEARPGSPRPHLPTGPVSALIGADHPPAWYFLGLYDAVGRDYEWADAHERPTDELTAFLHDPAVTRPSLRSRSAPRRRRGHARAASRLPPQSPTAGRCSNSREPLPVPCECAQAGRSPTTQRTAASVGSFCVMGMW